MTQFPAFIQAALLFDRKNPLDLDAFVRRFLTTEAGIGESYNIVADAKPGVFYRLYGANELMITVEYLDGRAQTPLFEATLGSPFTNFVTPDARDRIAAHQSHILIGVHHGPLTPTGEIGDLLKQFGMQPPGASLGAFEHRLAVCWGLAYIANQMTQASLIHWTSSDQLLTGAAFDKISSKPPSLLHIHPILIGAGENAQGQAMAEIKTFGAAHFLGREIHVLPCAVPWPETLEAIFAFIRLANLKQGYVIPDGDTFSPDDESVSYRVRHIAEGEKSGDFTGPLYQFELLYARALGFVSSDHIPPNRKFDDRNIPLDVSVSLGENKANVAMEWRAKRLMAEAAGVAFQVKAEKRPARPTLFGGLGRVIPFGRKK
jgi:hypothetical protein